MEAKHIQDIMEVYSSIYAQQEQEVLSEEVEQLDEITASMGRRAKKYREDQAQAAHMQSLEKHQENMKNPEYRERHERLRQTHSRKEDQKESFDLFDYLLEYLVAEGYADTNKAALAIMANMSEEWKQSIVEVWSSKLPGADALDRRELEKIKTVKTSTGQTVTTNKQYPATLNKEKGMKSYGPSGTEYFTPNIPGTNISDPNRAKFKSVSSGQYEKIPADQSSHLRTGVPKVDDSTKYNPSYKPPGMRK